ncbi:helix-turn-helix domain-containing protein [Micromonospora rubida]|uniref:helix-turn-helix domain-containing protein n=1 Tax=Micromonospora rubida TaxID=2697657 RepID=UPI0013770DAC|nr:helix-turn-helix transcriptional regulator [Micromonospora rubida]NBE79533.1 helix-turn-helix domain-containing protein [Micromonospora rubida]
MPARVRILVAPRFPAELARLRRQRGMSLRDLARRVYYSKSYLHDLEVGRTPPTSDVAGRLDTALQAGGQLAAMVIETPTVTTPDDNQRIAHVIAQPTDLDAVTVRLLADVLAAQRRLDDAVAAPLMLPSAVPQWRTVQELAAQAGGPHAPELHTVAAEWTQLLCSPESGCLRRRFGAVRHRAWLGRSRQGVDPSAASMRAPTDDRCRRTGSATESGTPTYEDPHTAAAACLFATRPPVRRATVYARSPARNRPTPDRGMTGRSSGKPCGRGHPTACRRQG